MEAGRKPRCSDTHGVCRARVLSSARCQVMAMGRPAKTMQNPIRNASPESTHAAGGAFAAYDVDAYTFAMEQAALPRAGRFAEVDIANVAEEIESVGRSEASKLRSALRVLLMDLLRWDHQHEKRSRSWVASIAAQRVRATQSLGENPGLTPRLPTIMNEAYATALFEASKETGLLPKAFPLRCPDTYGEAMTRDIPWLGDE